MRFLPREVRARAPLSLCGGGLALGLIVALSASCSRSHLLESESIGGGGGGVGGGGNGAGAFGAGSPSSGAGAFGAGSSSSGTGGFGAGSSSSGTGGFGAGSSSGGTGGFGAGSSSSGTGGFGAGSSSSGTGGFGAGSSSSSGTGGFGAGSSSSSGTGGFGAGSSSSSGTGGFGAGSSSSSGTGGFGAGSSSSSGTGGFGAGSSSSSGVGGSTGDENCTNGSDDDFDGAVDCADSDCTAGFVCVPPAPVEGWVGPVAFWEGVGGEVAPSCSSSGGFPSSFVSGGVNPVGGDPTCPACSCGSPVGVACQVATVNLFNNGTCAGNGGNLTIAAGVCQNFVTLNYDPGSARFGSAPAAGGACIPVPMGIATIPPVEWDLTAVACGDAPMGGGCGADLCVPKPNVPFEGQLCVYKPGDVPCPNGPYSFKRLYFESAVDTRTCSSCNCGAPTGLSCVGNMKLYSSQGCVNDEVILDELLECSPLAPDPTPPPPPYLSQRSIIYTGTSSGAGTCETIPSQASGEVTAEDPITVCCMP